VGVEACLDEDVGGHAELSERGAGYAFLVGPLLGVPDEICPVGRFVLAAGVAQRGQGLQAINGILRLVVLALQALHGHFVDE